MNYPPLALLACFQKNAPSTLGMKPGLFFRAQKILLIFLKNPRWNHVWESSTLKSALIAVLIAPAFGHDFLCRALRIPLLNYSFLHHFLTATTCKNDAAFIGHLTRYGNDAFLCVLHLCQTDWAQCFHFILNIGSGTCRHTTKQLIAQKIIRPFSARIRSSLSTLRNNVCSERSSDIPRLSKVNILS